MSPIPSFVNFFWPKLKYTSNITNAVDNIIFQSIQNEKSTYHLCGFNYTIQESNIVTRRITEDLFQKTARQVLHPHLKIITQATALNHPSGFFVYCAVSGYIFLERLSTSYHRTNLVICTTFN